MTVRTINRFVFSFLFSIASISAIGQSFDLAVYPLWNFDHLGKSIDFVSLTDSYAYIDHPDSLAIEDQHLGEIESENGNYHVPSSKYRTRFLNRMNINSTDSVYVFRFYDGITRAYAVRDLKLSAQLSGYETGSSIIEHYDYHIGFEVPQEAIPDDLTTRAYLAALVYVGKESPFVEGGMHPIKWQKFPEDNWVIQKEQFHKQGYKKVLTDQAVKFESNGLKYTVHSLMMEHGNRARVLRVMNTDSKELVFKEVFHDSEGSMTLPLNGVEPDRYGQYVYQWAGRLFKNKSAVVMGFLSHSFGCPRIYFLESDSEHLRIRCDNRH